MCHTREVIGALQDQPRWMEIRGIESDRKCTNLIVLMDCKHMFLTSLGRVASLWALVLGVPVDYHWSICWTPPD